MPNDLEDLFNRQPPLPEEDLIRIISHLRELRAQHESGIKAAKTVADKAKAVDLNALGLGKPKPTIGKIKLL